MFSSNCLPLSLSRSENQVKLNSPQKVKGTCGDNKCGNKSQNKTTQWSMPRLLASGQECLKWLLSLQRPPNASTFTGFLQTSGSIDVHGPTEVYDEHNSASNGTCGPSISYSLKTQVHARTYLARSQPGAAPAFRAAVETCCVACACSHVLI